MSGRGRGINELYFLIVLYLILFNLNLGKRSGSGPGPGRPPKNPNLNISKPQLQSEESNYMEQVSSAKTSMTASVSGGSGSGLVDILNQLDSNKRNEMLSLVGQYKGRSLSLNDFMMRARELLGERLYSQLSRDMSNAAAVRGSSNISGISGPNFGVPINLNVPTMIGSIPSISGMASMPGIPIRSQVPVSVSSAMHSMPQIYGNSQITQNLQYSYAPNTTTNPNVNIVNNSLEVDVSKMDTSSLQDVIQYSGVDLKAEAELLYREHDALSNTMNNYNNSLNSGSISVDHRLKFDYFFNPFKFRAIVQHALQRQFFSSTLQNSNSTAITSHANINNNTTTINNKPLGITEEAVHLLGIAIQKRLIGVLRRLAEISRHRVDYGRGRFKIKIENDPKKQIWLQEKLFIEGVGEDRRKISSTSATSVNNNILSSTNQTLLNPPTTTTAINKNTSSLHLQSKVSTGTNQSAGSSQSSSAVAATEDSVKTKLANVTAMAALGIRQKSWMSSATLNITQTSSSSSSSSSTGNTSSSNSQNPSALSSAAVGNDEKESSETYQHPLSNFYSLPSSTPLTDSELRAQYHNRTISTVDLINCMESDSHLKRSRLLFVLYESLPRENKENKEKENSEAL